MTGPQVEEPRNIEYRETDTTQHKYYQPWSEAKTSKVGAELYAQDVHEYPNELSSEIPPVELGISTPRLSRREGAF
jgi:hypothetical protein